MYWYRIEQSLCRNRLVATTVSRPDDIPEDLGADEKYTQILGEKTYAATTVGSGCILGASAAMDAGKNALTKAYGKFKYEAGIHSENSPRTVNYLGLLRKYLPFSVMPTICFITRCSSAFGR